MKLGIALVSLLACHFAVASDRLIVIYDSGDTLPITPYLPKPAERVRTAPKTATAQLPFQLPITTPSMTPGPVAVTEKPLRYLRRPLFLVGADAHSKRWLAEKRDQLAAVNAVGLLIQADTEADVETMAEVANGLRLVPASAESIASLLGLTHYPVLLSQDGWEQ